MADTSSTLTPGQKLLQLVEILSNEGPLSLDQAANQAGFSRSATHRLLTSLVELNWARLRRSDRRYQLTSKLKNLAEKAPYYLEETEMLVELIEDTIGDVQVKYTIAIVLDKVARVVETIEPRQDSDVVLPYLKDDLAMGTLLSVDLPKLAGLVKQEIEMAQTENVDLPNLNEFHRKLIDARQAGRIEPRVRQVILPFTLHEDIYGAVRLKSSHTVEPAEFEACVSMIQTKLNGLKAA